MRLAPLLLCSFAAGCAPPNVDLVDGNGGGTTSAIAEPAIRIIYPPDNSEFELDCDGAIRFLVAVDLDNFELVENAPEVVEGQGHWHIALIGVDDPYGEPSYAQFYDLERLADKDDQPISPGTYRVDVRLVDNDHQDVEGARVSDSVELTFVDPPATACP